jgi:hypothetical protein
MGTPGRVSRKCAARLHRSSQGAPCPIRTTPTDSCESSRLRAAREPRAEITGCPSDWRISSRTDNRLSRNSTCTIVVMVLRSVCPRNSLAPRLGAVLAPSGGNPKFWQQPLRQDHIGDKKCHSPNPIGHVHPLLSADSDFTQKRHHGTPISESRLKQIQANKSCKEVPVRT